MKRIALFIAFITCTALSVQAQNASSSAVQTVKLSMSDVVEITFVSTGTATGNSVTMAFNNVNDYANGVASAAQELRVRSNKNFKVGVKYDLNTFMYTGSGSLAGINISPDALRLMVAGNNTGGTVAPAFSTSVYKPLAYIDQDLLLNGVKGGDQRFSVKYQFVPGWELPAGNYSIDVVYTATAL